ncbi:MAG: ABC transporter permease [Acidobacteria bacterium]|nr:ABC transporter permease [Acidobacteriota bacterium]
MRRILAQARKELTQVKRDRLTLALALILPLALLALNGEAISLSVTDLPIVIQDMDSSPASRRLIDVFRGSLTFRIVELSPGEKPERALLENRARAAIIIPENFERDLTRGRNAETQVLVDASDANTANVMRGSATAVIQSFSNSLSRSSSAVRNPPIKLNTRLWFNPGRESRMYIVPSMLAVGLALFPPLLAALAMSREGEQKTILQVYVSSITAGEYLLGKILAYFAIALLEWFLCILLVYFMFGLSLRGDPTPLFVCTIVYLFTNVCFGTMVGVAIPNQAAAIQAVQIVGFLLSYLLSGAIFPISNIPPAIGWISNLIPARYYIEVVRDAFLRGSGWSGLVGVPFALAAIGLFFFVVAWLKMRKMQIEA